MDVYFKAFKLFRENHWEWGGKNQFKKYYKLIHCNKESNFNIFLVQCVIAKILNEKKRSFLCNIHIDKKFHRLFEIESNKPIEIKPDIPEKVREAIKIIKEYSEEQLKSF